MSTMELQSETEHETEHAPPAPTRWGRIGLLAVLFGGSLLAAKLTGLTEMVSVESIRALMDTAGPFGFFAFVAAFGVGELMHIPGVVFVGGAALAYGPIYGALAAYLGAVGSVILSFVVVRAVGGQPLGNIQRPRVKRILSRLDDHPVTTVALLRLIFWMAPFLNYGLAMSKVRFRDYLLGSAIGLALPIPLVVYFMDVALRFMG